MIDLMEEEEHKKLPNGWRIGEIPPQKLEEHLRYTRQVAKELAVIPRQKKERPDLSHLTEAEKQEYYFNEQPESTKQAILRQRERRPEDDNDYLLRPIAEGYLANPEAKSLDELTAKRAIDPEEALREKALKTGRNQMGQSTKASASPERKESAAQAFTYSKPANPTDEEIRRLKKLRGLEAVVTAEPPKKEKPKRPWWKFWEKEEGKGAVQSDWNEVMRIMKERNK